MLLLDTESSTVNTTKKVIIISDSVEVQEELSQILRANGIENLDIINKPFYSVDIALNVDEVIGVIVDIGEANNPATISEQITAFVPQEVWCCLVGASDSIALSHKFLEKSIPYFNRSTQLDTMVKRILTGSMTVSSPRNTVKICVLGCKGGIGSSFISARVAHNIATMKKVPVLLAQGTNGSQDLDLLFEKKLQGELYEFSNNLHLYDGNITELTESEMSKFNFVVYDQPIFNLKKDAYAEFFNIANSFVLVVERHPNSLRIAKQFLAQVTRQRTNAKQLIRTFVCIVDSRLEHSVLMSQSDIETLLETEVDAVIPFLKKTNGKNVIELKLDKKATKVFHQLTMKVIGVLSRDNKKGDKQSSLLGTIWKKILN